MLERKTCPNFLPWKWKRWKENWVIKQNLLLHLSTRKPFGDSMRYSAICISTHNGMCKRAPAEENQAMWSLGLPQRWSTGISEHSAVPSIRFGMKSTRFPYGLKCTQGHFHLWIGLWLTEQATYSTSIWFAFKGNQTFCTISPGENPYVWWDSFLPKALIIFT